MGLASISSESFDRRAIARSRAPCHEQDCPATAEAAAPALAHDGQGRGDRLSRMALTRIVNWPGPKRTRLGKQGARRGLSVTARGQLGISGSSDAGRRSAMCLPSQTARPSPIATGQVN